MPPLPRRFVVALVAGVLLFVPASASAQTSTIPETGAGVSTTPPVPLSEDDGDGEGAASGELPNTGADPRMLFLTGLALTLLGFGLRLRTADADEY